MLCGYYLDITMGREKYIYKIAVFVENAPTNIFKKKLDSLGDAICRNFFENIL